MTAVQSVRHWPYSMKRHTAADEARIRSGKMGAIGRGGDIFRRRSLCAVVDRAVGDRAASVAARRRRRTSRLRRPKTSGVLTSREKSGKESSRCGADCSRLAPVALIGIMFFSVAAPVVGADRQDRVDQQLYRFCRPARRPGLEGHRSLCQGAREGPAAGRQDRDPEARRHLQPGGRQAAGAGVDHPRPCAAADRRRPVAGRRRGGADDRAGEGAAACSATPPPASRYRGSRPMWCASPSRCGRNPTRSANGRPSRAGRPGYTAVTDFIAGHDAEAAFTKAFTDGGGKIVGADRFPLANPDFRTVRAAHQGRQARRRLHLRAGRHRRPRR